MDRLRPLLLLAALAGLAACQDDLADKLKHDFRHSAAFVPLGQTISLNQQLNDALGAPIEFGDFNLTNYDPDKHLTTIDVKLTGPKGAGHATIRLAQPDPKMPWVSKGGDFFPTSGPPIHLQPR